MKDFLQRYWRIGMAALVVAGIMMLALSGYLAPIFEVALDPLVAVQRWLGARYIAIYQLVRSPSDVTSLREENEMLRAQNASLQSQIIELQQEQKNNEIMYALLNVARTRPDSKPVAALVIGRDSNPFMRYILIDQGSDDGLRRGMPVLSHQGLVGRVDAVTANAARVQLITDPGSAVNVRLRDSEADAMLVGSVTGDLTLDMISQEVKVNPGELILTSGLGGTYPADILVGQVVSIRKQETALFQTASVQASVDFANLSGVLVITQFRSIDLDPLIEAP